MDTSELEKIIASQRHEIAQLHRFREEDKFARQLLDKNACQRRVEELEKELAEANKRIELLSYDPEYPENSGSLYQRKIDKLLHSNQELEAEVLALKLKVGNEQR